MTVAAQYDAGTEVVPQETALSVTVQASAAGGA